MNYPKSAVKTVGGRAVYPVRTSAPKVPAKSRSVNPYGGSIALPRDPAPHKPTVGAAVKDYSTSIVPPKPIVYVSSTQPKGVTTQQNISEFTTDTGFNQNMSVNPVINPTTDLNQGNVPSDLLAQFNAIQEQLDSFGIVFQDASNNFQNRRNTIIARWNEAVANNVDRTTYQSIIGDLQQLLNDVANLAPIQSTATGAIQQATSIAGMGSVILVALIGAAIYYFTK